MGSIIDMPESPDFEKPQWPGMPAGSNAMNANAQNMNETFRAAVQQWSDAALKAVSAHEQFVGNVLGTANRPMNLENWPAPARNAFEQTSQFVVRQALEGEKFVAGLMREGIEAVREQGGGQAEMKWPLDADKVRADADRFMKQAGDVMKRQAAFVNERFGEMAEFGRSMMECGFEAAKCGAANPSEGEPRKVKVASKA